MDKNLTQLDHLINFKILSFNEITQKQKIISHNKLLNYIALDSNKTITIRKNNYDTCMKLIGKIRSFNQFGDKI